MVRVLFYYCGYSDLLKVQAHADRWWVCSGRSLVSKYSKKYNCQAWYLDGKLLAVPAGDRILFRDRWSVDTMTVDDRPFTVEGREWDPGRDTLPGLCVFCGKKEKHVNAGGNAWWCGFVRPDGKVTRHLYCNRPECNNGHVWECRDCHVDVIGDACSCCNGTRAAQALGPDDD